MLWHRDSQTMVRLVLLIPWIILSLVGHSFLVGYQPYLMLISSALVVWNFSFSCLFHTKEIWHTGSMFDYRVLLCLKRSLRIANAAQQMANVARGSSGPITLFVEILNKLVPWMYLSVDFGFTARKVITWGNTLSCFVKVKFTHLMIQVPLFLWEGKPADYMCCNSGANRSDKEYAKWHHNPGSSFRCFLCQCITLHSVSERERRCDGWLVQ